MSSHLRTAAIIGAHWGMIHLPTLREAGLDVIAVVSKDLDEARSVAQANGIKVGTDSVGDVGTPDVVVVATPAFTHAEVISAFPYSHIFCEKPVVGWQGDPSVLPSWSQRMLVNYAFSHLETAQKVEASVSHPKRVSVKSSVNLEGFRFNSPQWFFEVVSHPISWLFHWLGEPRKIHTQVNESTIETSFTCGETSVDVAFLVGGPAGIHHEFLLYCDEGHIEFQGDYSPGQPWNFSPILKNDIAVNDGEFAEEDVWLAANRKALLLALSVFSGERSLKDAETLGAFGVAKALWMERLFANGQ